MFRRAKQYTSGSYESYKYINSEKVVYGMGGGGEWVLGGMLFIYNTYLKLLPPPKKRTLNVILHCDTDPEGFSKSPPAK